MLSQPKNKMIERFRTQKNPATERHFSEKEEKEASSSCIDMNFHAVEANLGKTADRSSKISTYFQKHIEYLEKKLADADAETNKAKLYSEILETKLDEQYAENDTMLSKMAENQKSTKQLLFKYEMLVSDHQNLKLKHKMEKLHRQINEQKETQSHIQIKSRQLKQGKYSTAFLPSPFDSPNRTSQQKTESNELVLDNLSNPSFDKSLKSSPKQKNPINSHLMDEYQRLKHQKEKRQKQILQLKAQNGAIKTELDAKNKQYNKLLSDRSNKSMNLSNEIIKWKEKVQKQKQQNKLLFNKLKSTEMKMLQLSQIMKNDGNNENGKDLQYQQSNNIYLSSIKQQKDCQTEDIVNPQSKQTQKMQQYISKIASLKSQLLERTKQYNKREEEIRNKYSSELRKCTELMEQYRSRAEAVTQDMSKQRQWRLTDSVLLDIHANNQAASDSTKKQFKNSEVQCLIIASGILQERQYILQKAKIFIDFNEQQKSVIERLTKQKDQLKEQISHQQNFKITLLQEERNNFSNIYSELRKRYEQLELDFQQQTKGLNEQLTQRQIQLNDCVIQLEVGSAQVPILNQKIAQYELRVVQYQKSIEEYQLKMEILNQQIDALRQNP